MFVFIPLVIQIEGNQIKIGVAAPGQAEFCPVAVKASRSRRAKRGIVQTHASAKPSVREMLLRPSLN